MTDQEKKAAAEDKAKLKASADSPILDRSNLAVSQDEAVGVFSKKFVNKFGMSKYYLKFNRPQTETVDPNTKLPIMVYADGKDVGKECAYYENLTDEQIKAYKQF